MSKFAAITSSLLARKGEARPWMHDAAMIPRQEPVLYDVQKPPRLASASPPPPPKEKSCSVRMSAQDYERLGILAVKRGVTRQALLKEALANLLAAQSKTYACACLAGSETCGDCCT